jgi:hypothetical protein
MRRRLLPTLALTLLAGLILAQTASADFGLKDQSIAFLNKDGSVATQAGSHPYVMKTTLDLNTKNDPSLGGTVPDGLIRDGAVDLPPGFIVDPTSVPRCSNADFANVPTHPKTLEPEPTCPLDTVVGYFELRTEGRTEGDLSPVWNLAPPPGVASRLGFRFVGVSAVIEGGVIPGGEHNLTAGVSRISQVPLVTGSQFTLWGNPTDPSHDEDRGYCIKTDESCSVLPLKKPFFTLPRSCTGPLRSVFRVDSWENPGVWDEQEAFTPGMTGCGKLSFAPSVGSQATTALAETGTGLDIDVDVDDEGLISPRGIAQSDIRNTVVKLPPGMTINPSAGEGLGVCTPADLKRERVNSEPGEGCPEDSKLGSLHVITPLLNEAVDGSIYLAQQDDLATTKPGAENPFDSLFALYFVLRNTTQGILIRLPVKVEPDEKTGQLTATITDIPQLPFSHFNAHLRTGARAALVTPGSCGSFPNTAEFTPWADPTRPIVSTSFVKIERGVNGGPCPPGGVPPFHPEYQSGSINNNAKSYSPFNLRLIRNDGEQDMTKFSSVLPPGVLGKLAGVSKCPDSAVAVAKGKTGRQERATPSCPANSLIGHSLAGAGVGSALTYVPGQIYLGGAYRGDPLSVISITPAVAGPFDAGTVVTRLALTLNPVTAEVEVDGAASDPIPHILKGIVLKVRDIRVYVDRPDFIINPTSCDPSSAKATLFGGFLDVFSPNDDIPVDLSNRYQAANCRNLAFKPKLSLKLQGGTKRGDHPALRAELKARPGDANIGSAVVTLPRSAFLDQAHIRTICTRVQFAAKACPKGAEYGYARAWTPLLDEPIEGPVYLRSSNHKLPDLVIALHGLVDVNVSSRIDSKHGGIRNSFEAIPDAPVTKFVLSLQGGKKGLVVNSRSLCAAPSRADALFTGQNGVPYHFHPLLQPKCGGKGKKAK